MDLANIMELAKSVKEQLDNAQRESANLRVRGEAGGGLVAVVVNGRYEVLEVHIDPKAVDPSDLKLLEDLVRAATNQALANVGEALKSRVGSLASGLGFDLGSLGIK